MPLSLSCLRRRALSGVVCALAVILAAGVSEGAQSKTRKATPTRKTKAVSTRTATSARKPTATKASAKSSNRKATTRRARLARARAAARARELAAAKIPQYKLTADGDLVPDVRAAAAIVYSPATGEILWESGGFAQRSIASITKVMTAICFLEEGPDLDRWVAVDRADTRGASTTYLRAGETLRLSDVLRLALVASDNVAARTLARASLRGADAFIGRMNQRATELGLTATQYTDASGLDARNVSSAYDQARLISYATNNELMAAVMRTQEYTLQTSRRVLTIRNTNKLVGSPDVEVQGGKTGFIARSGHCLVTMLRLPASNQSVAVVVLGARSNAGRFWETRHILNWISARASSVLGGQPPQQPD